VALKDIKSNLSERFNPKAPSTDLSGMEGNSVNPKATDGKSKVDVDKQSQAVDKSMVNPGFTPTRPKRVPDVDYDKGPSTVDPTKGIYFDPKNLRTPSQSPRSDIDRQIESGVDFFPNDDADGFIPRTNLESFYKRVPAGIDNQINNGVDFFPNDDAIGFVTNPPKQASDFQIPSVPKPGGIGTTQNETQDTDAPIADTLNIDGSFYNMVRNGVMGIPWPDAAPSYEKDRLGTFNHYTIPIGYDVKMVEPGDTFGTPWSSDFPQFQSPFMETPISTYESIYPKEASLTWNGSPLGRMTSKSSTWPEAAVSYHKTRDVYQNYYLNAPFNNIPLDKNLFNPPGGWALGSINIFPEDVLAPLGPDNVATVDIFPKANEIVSGFSNPSDSQTFTMPAIKTTQNLSGRIPAIANYSAEKNVGPFTFTGDNTLDINSLSSEENLGTIDTLHSFENGEFSRVPAGLNQNMVLGTKTYREVADPFTTEGFRQPFILRPFPENDGVAGPGNGRWGVDPIDSVVPGYIGSAIGEFTEGFFRGAPTFTGLIERNIVDKIRIGKFLSTPAGIGFLGRQAAMQFLNPTIETRLYNPLSVVGISLGVLTDPSELLASPVDTIAKTIAGFSLPISHVQRHIGGIESDILDIDIGGNYETSIKNTSEAGHLASGLLDFTFNHGSSPFDPKSRLAYQAIAHSSNIPDIPMIQFSTGIGFLDSFIRRTLDGLVSHVEAGLRAPKFVFSNPNRYATAISSAPLTVEDGVPTFTASPFTLDLARKDLVDAASPAVLKGSTFVKKSNDNNNNIEYAESSTALGIVKRHSTLDYQNLDPKNAYGKSLFQPSELNFSPTYDNMNEAERTDKFKITKDVGQQGAMGDLDTKDGRSAFDLGLIKGDTKSPNVDKVNIHPYGSDDLPDDVRDYIKFKFYDVINKKFIIFRAILNGITDTVKPNYGSENYMGRPDKVYVYQNTDRSVSFNFRVVPKTKQEFPVLLEKMNYLVGMCYPSYTEGERMITPFMRLTLGDMFVNVPGLLDSVNVTVEDSSTWELEEGLQFPHYISVAVNFIYIGEHVLASKGKHYGLNWIPDGTVERFDKGGKGLGFNDSPHRKKYSRLFRELGQSN